MVNILKRILFLVLLAAILPLAGCPGPGKHIEPDAIIKGMGSIEASAAALKAHKAGIIPVMAYGKLKYIYFDNGRKKEENLDANLRFDPPNLLFFNATSALGEAIRLGANDEEFWFHIKPKEVSQYFWGTWKQLGQCESNLLITPESMLDALGMVTVDSSWMRMDYNGQDMLVKLGDDGRVKKRIFVNRKGYLVSRIEYYDNEEFKTLTVDMSDYKPVGDGSPIPTKINITDYNIGEVEAKIEITLKSPRFLKPEKIKENLFKRPPPKGFKSIFKMSDNCKFVEQ
ncbi:MAG: outer membrane lipoprotein-sorting protein [Phycisphaerae bacterium]|nr:outer membrane lipoprotein-sorting protein [Phycisphaerae bacterium]